jgi:HlyD family secretion protein
MMKKKSSSFSKQALRILTILLVMAGLIGGGYFGYLRFSAAKATATQETPVQTSKATVGDLVLYAHGTGAVMPATESSLGFNTNGQVSQIKVTVGDQVKAGDVLAQLDDTEEQIQLANAQQAMDALTSASAIATATQNLATAENDFATAKSALEYLISPEVLYWEEQVAQRQQTLTDAQTAYQTDTSAAAKQKVTDAQTSLQYAQDSLTYFQTVYRKNYIPATFTQYHTFTFRGRTITEPVTTEDKHGKKHNVIIPPTDAEIGIARANYDLAKASIAEAQTYLDVLNGTEIADGATGADLITYIQTKHALETAQYNLNATKLISPIAGTITAIDTNVGDLVQTGSSVITVSNIDQPYMIDAYLDAKDWGQIRVGYPVEASFDILPDQVFQGIVTSVYPTLDTSSSNATLIHFTAQLNSAIPYELPAGSSTSVQVIGGSAENAVLVPVEALHQFGDGKYALFVMTKGKLRLRVVQVGVMNLTQAQIISGLNAGEIVTTGLTQVK